MKASEDKQNDTTITKEERIQMLMDTGLEELEAEWRLLGVYEQESKLFPKENPDRLISVAIESLQFLSREKSNQTVTKVTL